jgi:LysR family glycine cleavage system transcriptional activator
MRNRLPSMTGLRSFEAAARHMSFTRAAFELNQTPTAVGHQIRKLEDLLSARLFVRNNNTLTLTDAARDYLRIVRGALLDLSFATNRMAEANDEEVLTVQCPEAFAFRYLLPRLRDFRERYPYISLRLHTGHRLEAASHGRFDVAIWHGEGTWPNVRVSRLAEEEIFPVCSPCLLDGPMPLREPEDLAGHTVIHTSSLPLREEWPLWLKAAGIGTLEFSDQLTCDSHATAIHAAAAGLGIVLARASVVAGDLAQGRLVEPFGLRIASVCAYYLVVRPQSQPPRKVRLFAEWLVPAGSLCGAPAQPALDARALRPAEV